MTELVDRIESSLRTMKVINAACDGSQYPLADLALARIELMNREHVAGWICRHNRALQEFDIRHPEVVKFVDTMLVLDDDEPGIGYQVKIPQPANQSNG